MKKKPLKQSRYSDYVTVEEELDGIDINGIGNLMDIARLIFINEECGNFKVVFDGE